MHELSWNWDFAAGRRGPPWSGTAWGARGGHGKPEWFGDWMGGPPPRAERGGVRYLVLDALADQPRHGYEIIQAIEERSGGRYRPSPGVIYPTLQMLEELGLAHVTEKESRKIYAITQEGLRDLEEHRDEVADFYSRFVEDSWERYVEDFGEVMKGAARLFRTFKRAARRGGMSPKTVIRIRAILDDAVTRIQAAIDEDR